MGIYTDGKIYGIFWYNYKNSNIEDEEYDKKYIKEYSTVLTDEQRHEIYADFLRLIPENERSLYHFRVYTRSYTTYEPVSINSYFFSWFPLEEKYLLEYFNNGHIVGF